MAKQSIQDSRVNFIEAIGRTDNLKVLRSITASMNTMDYKFNLSISELNKILEEGVAKIKKLLGNSANEFFPLEVIESTSPQTYFSKIDKGYFVIEARKDSMLKLDKTINDIKSKLHKAKEKGKLNKVKELENKLFAWTYPNENILKLEKLLLDIKEGYSNGTISLEDYEPSVNEINKRIKISKEALKLLDNIKKGAEKKEQKQAMKSKENEKKKTKKEWQNLEPKDLVYMEQKEIRWFLCYLFFERTAKVHESPNRFLSNYEGEMTVDFEHMLLLYNYLKSQNYENLNEIEAVLYYFALERFYCDVNQFSSKTKGGIFLKTNPTEFYSEKYSSYTRGYIANYLLPDGYRGYVFEPNNLAQQSFICAINKENLNVDSMVSAYKESQKELKSRENGILFSFLPKELEEKLMPSLVTSDFPLNEMDGDYANCLMEEFLDRRKNFGGSESSDVMTNMYMRVVKPYCLEVLGSYVRNFCNNLSELKDKEMIYIYYVSPQRIAIAVREDITEQQMNEVFPQIFINSLKKIKSPTLEEIVFGNYL